MQTEGEKQFRVTWQVGFIIGSCLLALALPIAGVMLTLHGLTKNRSQEASSSVESNVSGGLENVLEGLAEEKLAPGTFGVDEMTIEMITSDVKAERARLEELLKGFAGIAIPTVESESEIRLLVRIPANRLGDFLVKFQGAGKRFADPAGGLLQIVIRKNKVQ